MTNHQFLSGRVTWSAPWDDGKADANCPPSDTDTLYGTQTCNCLNVWGDYARQSNLDAIYTAIGNSYVGVAADGKGYGGLTCGGTIQQGNLLLSPMYNTQPSIVDSHMYPTTLAGLGDTYVQQAAALDFSDLAHFFSLPGMQAALVMIGETHDFRVCPDYPSEAPYSNAAGFNQSMQTLGNQSLVSGHSVFIRPFMNLGGVCQDGVTISYPYGPNGAQNENYNLIGPYNPSRFNY